MDEEVRRKILHSFFSTKGSKGTGLGLMLTQKMVREHGGMIEFDSAVGAGSTFRIVLPALRDASKCLPQESMEWKESSSKRKDFIMG